MRLDIGWVNIEWKRRVRIAWESTSNSHGTTAMVSKLVNSLNAVDQVYFPLNAGMSWNFNGDLWIRVASLSTAQDEAAQMKGLLEITLWTDD